MELDYQVCINLFAEMMSVALPIGTTFVLLEKLVQMFYDAVGDRWYRRHE